MADEGIIVYAAGLCAASVCAPDAATHEEVEVAANLQHPTGVGPWEIADEPFASGEPNPCRCTANPNRLHYLLHC